MPRPSALARFPNHLRPYVFSLPQFREQLGPETPFLLTLFSGKDGNGWAFLLRPLAGAESTANFRNGHRPAPNWALTVDTGQVVDVIPSVRENDAVRNGVRQNGSLDDSASEVVPVPPTRSNETSR